MQPKVRMFKLKIKIKCFSSWTLILVTPLTIRLLPGVKAKWLTVYMLDCSFFFFWNLEEMSLWLVYCSLVWQDIKLLKTLFLWSSFSEWSGKWASGLVLTLAQIKVFSSLIIDCLLVIFINSSRGGIWYVKEYKVSIENWRPLARPVCPDSSQSPAVFGDKDVPFLWGLKSFSLVRFLWLVSGRSSEEGHNDLAASVCSNSFILKSSVCQDAVSGVAEENSRTC